jgi:hypothetical protein
MHARVLYFCIAVAVDAAAVTLQAVCSLLRCGW